MCVVRLSGTYSCLLLIKSLRCKRPTPPTSCLQEAPTGQYRYQDNGFEKAAAQTGHYHYEEYGFEKSAAQLAAERCAEARRETNGLRGGTVIIGWMAAAILLIGALP